MSWDLLGKVAIVTGAGSGICLAFAEKLLNAGCSVVFADIALCPEAMETVAKFPFVKNGVSAIYHEMDQSNWDHMRKTWNFALETFGRVDLLCPGAGIWEPPSSAFWEFPGVSNLAKDDPNSIHGSYKIFEVNAMGPIRFSQIALEYWMREKIPGNVIFVSSQSAYVPSVGTPLYNATKGALCSFAQSLAQLKQRLGIRVTTMCPSVTYTPATQAEYCKAKILKGDMNMTPEECAQVMLCQVSDPEFGNGEIVEAMQFGKNKSNVKSRKVPYEELYPLIVTNDDYSGKRIAEVEEDLWKKLQNYSTKL